MVVLDYIKNFKNYEDYCHKSILIKSLPGRWGTEDSFCCNPPKSVPFLVRQQTAIVSSGSAGEL